MANFQVKKKKKAIKILLGCLVLSSVWEFFPFVTQAGDETITFVVSAGSDAAPAFHEEPAQSTFLQRWGHDWWGNSFCPRAWSESDLRIKLTCFVSSTGLNIIFLFSFFFFSDTILLAVLSFPPLTAQYLSSGNGTRNEASFSLQIPRPDFWKSVYRSGIVTAVSTALPPSVKLPGFLETCKGGAV